MSLEATAVIFQLIIVLWTKTEAIENARCDHFTNLFWSYTNWICWQIDECGVRGEKSKILQTQQMRARTSNDLGMSTVV